MVSTAETIINRCMLRRTHRPVRNSRAAPPHDGGIPGAVTDRRRRSLAAPIVLAIVLAIPLAAWLLRGTIATSMARSEIEARGLRCDERFSVELSALFGEATIGPTRCTREGGLVEALELTGDATIELDGLTPAAVRAESVRVVLRDQDLRGGSGWAAQLRRINLEQRVAGLVKGLAELGGMNLPPTDIAHAEVFRGGEELAAIDGLVLTPSSSTDLAIQQVAFSAVGGAARLTLEGVTGSATPSAVHLEGDATARAGIALLGAFTTGGAFSLDASALDTSAPRLRLRAEL